MAAPPPHGELSERLTGEKRVREALARPASRLRRPHGDEQQRRRRQRAAEEAQRNPRRGVNSGSEKREPRN
jgi:hypothetical protein